MVIKGSQSINIFFTTDGHIELQQYSTEFGKSVAISFNYEQFKAIEHFVFKNKDEIELAWNDGVSDE